VKIEVLLFAQLKEEFGTDTRILDVTEGQTVREAVQLLFAEHRDSKLTALPLSFAVNEEMVDGDYRLCDGDRLAVLTPVSGG